MMICEANWRGRWALVTGASSGIGEALSRALAANGAHLVLTARRSDRLMALAAELRAQHGVRVEIYPDDLTDTGAPDRIAAFVESREIQIDVLINNAGVLRHGAFHVGDLQAQLDMVRLHCEAVTHLTHLFLPGMVERRSGYILILATTMLAPAPYLSLYAATKGFDLLLAEGLSEEVARFGVRVCALCPGPTRSEMGHVSADGDHALQDAKDVAIRGLRGLARGTVCIRPSWMARILANAPRVLPRRTVSGMLERVYRPDAVTS